VKLEPGMIVKIFQKPVEGRRFEGNAKLVEQTHPDEGDGLSLWWVEFQDELGHEYLRTINTANAE